MNILYKYNGNLNVGQLDQIQTTFHSLTSLRTVPQPLSIYSLCVLSTPTTILLCSLTLMELSVQRLKLHSNLTLALQPISIRTC